jgi:hypothetical protein
MKVTLSHPQTAARSRRQPPRRRPGAMVTLAAAAALTCGVLLAGAGVTLAAASPPAAAAAAARVHWGRAEPVPGLAALNQGVDHGCSASQPGPCASAAVDAMSCWGQGGCMAGGHYADKHDDTQAFVAEERKGRWGKAQEVPGTAALNKGGYAKVLSLSCVRTTVCVAVGTYTDAGGGGHWFTTTERNGRWASATPVPSLAGAGISAVWCVPGGLCVAAGSFSSSGAQQVWVETQTHGRWQPAGEVPGIAALNVGGNASIDAVACASAGNCAAAGLYASATGQFPPFQPFVVTETNGKWGTAREVAGLEGHTPGLWADVTTIACPSAGNCTAAGNYQSGVPEACQGPSDGCSAVFVVNERHGSWGQAALVGKVGYALSLTCLAAGDCTVGGYAENGADVLTGALIDETNDRWAPAFLIPGTYWVNSVSCAQEGYCAAGGSTGAYGAFVISENHGAWGKAVTPAGLPPQNGSTAASVYAVACPPRIAICVAAGFENPANTSRAQAFTASQAR